MHTEFNSADVISKNSIRFLNRGQTLFLFSDFYIPIDNETGISWGAFLMDDLMSPLVLIEITNNHVRNIAFTINATGIYYITFTIVPKLNAATTAYLRTNTKNHLCSVKFPNLNHYNDFDMMSRGCLLFMNTSEQLSLFISQLNTKSSDWSCELTSVRGFLYSPYHNNKVAWSVHSSSELKPKINATLQFTEILVNTDNVWNKTTNSITVTTSGLYYLEVVGTSADKGFKSIDMCVIKNLSTKLLLLRLPSDKGGMTRSRSALNYLLVGDNLTVISQDDVYKLQGISFQGFLLY